MEVDKGDKASGISYCYPLKIFYLLLTIAKRDGKMDLHFQRKRGKQRYKEILIAFLENVICRFKLKSIFCTFTGYFAYRTFDRELTICNNNMALYQILQQKKNL